MQAPPREVAHLLALSLAGAAMPAKPAHAVEQRDLPTINPFDEVAVMSPGALLRGAVQHRLGARTIEGSQLLLEPLPLGRPPRSCFCSRGERTLGRLRLPQSDDGGLDGSFNRETREVRQGVPTWRCTPRQG